MRLWLVGIAIRVVNSEALEPARADIPTSFLVDLYCNLKIGTTIAKKKDRGTW